MPKPKIKNKVTSILIDKLVAHPDSPNRMGKSKFAKLTRNIKRTGRYEPLVVRPYPGRRGFFQIINGHHRCQALRDLGHKTVEAMIWDLDDYEADMLLATVNRLCGSDVLDKKLAVLSRLDQKNQSTEMARLLPLSRTQIERLTTINNHRLPLINPAKVKFAAPLVFFVDSRQKKTIENALSLAQEKSGGRTKADKNAKALTNIAEYFNLKSQKSLSNGNK